MGQDHWLNAKSKKLPLSVRTFISNCVFLNRSRKHEPVLNLFAKLHCFKAFQLQFLAMDIWFQ